MMVSADRVRMHYADTVWALVCLLILFHHSLRSDILRLLNHYLLDALSFFFTACSQSGSEIIFVISGCIILLPIVRASRDIDVVSHYYRRFIRKCVPYIVPIFFASLVIALNHNDPKLFSKIHISFSWKFFFQQIALMNFIGNYISLSWWSLQIEVIFHLVLSFVPLLFAKAALGRTVVYLLMLSYVLQWLCLRYFPSYFSVDVLLLNPFQFVEYLLCLVFGVFLAKEDYSTSVALRYLVVGLVFLVSGYWHIPNLHVGFGMLYFGILLLLTCNATWQLLSGSLLGWIGERPYSLFLVFFSAFCITNYFISYFVHDRGLVCGVLTRCVGWGGIPILVAKLVFHFFERRFARGLQTADQFWPPIFPFKR